MQNCLLGVDFFVGKHSLQSRKFLVACFHLCYKVRLTEECSTAAQAAFFLLQQEVFYGFIIRECLVHTFYR